MNVGQRGPGLSLRPSNDGGHGDEKEPTKETEEPAVKQEKTEGWCLEARGGKRTEEERTVTLVRCCWQSRKVRTEVIYQTKQRKGYLEGRGL